MDESEDNNMHLALEMNDTSKLSSDMRGQVNGIYISTDYGFEFVVHQPQNFFLESLHCDHSGNIILFM